MKNTFVWGFCYDCDGIILDLESKNLINIKAWIKEFPVDKKFCYNIFDFFSESWLHRYRKDINYYTSDVNFNYDAYQIVYQKLYSFIDCYSRHDKIYQEKELHYYINMFNLLYRFFFGIFEKEKIELVLFSNIPHEGAELLIYEIAKFFNIKTLILTQSLFPNKLFYVDCIEDFGNFNTMYQQHSDSCVKIKKQFYQNHWYMNNIKTYDFTFWELIKKALQRPLKMIKVYHAYLPKYKAVKKYLKNLKTNSVQVDYNKKFVYFPLHLQPELTTSALGGIFCDQLLVLEILSELIPDDWIIYVKENPKQTEFMRSDIFFNRLSLLDKVKLTPMTENTFKLIEKSQFVATISGTAAWESINGGKPALVFGKAWFKNFHGIFKYDKDFKIESLLNYKFDYDILEQELNNLVNKMGDGIIDSDYEATVENYSKEDNIKSVSKLLQELISKEENEVSTRNSTIRS